MYATIKMKWLLRRIASCNRAIDSCAAIPKTEISFFPPPFMATGAGSAHNVTGTFVAPSLDSPPPYTEVGRRPRPSRLHRAHARLQAQAHATQPEQDTPSLNEEPSISEETPLLPPGFTVQYGPPTLDGISRAHSFASTTSGVPTLGQNVTALFRGDDMMDVEDILSEGPLASADDELASIRSSRRERCLSSTGWKLYFRPISRKAYYKALFHLLVINFPYALLALLFLFVFTVVRLCLPVPDTSSITQYLGGHHTTDCTTIGRCLMLLKPSRRSHIFSRRACASNPLPLPAAHFTITSSSYIFPLSRTITIRS